MHRLFSIAVFVAIAVACGSGAAQPAGSADAGTDAGRDDGVELGLSADERAWIAAHPQVVIGVSVDHPPAVVVGEQGRYSGVVVDFVDLLRERLGIDFRLEVGHWHEVLERGVKHEVDVLGISLPVPSLLEHFEFTDPQFETYYYLFVRDRESAGDLAPSGLSPGGLEAFKGRRVGYLDSAGTAKLLLQPYPEVIAQAYPSKEQLAAALLGGQVDAVVASSTLDYWRRSTLQTGFRAAGLIPGSRSGVVMSVRRDWPLLTRILNKGLASISGSERQAIIVRWLGSELPAPAQDAVELDLSADEQAWLREHPVIRAAIDPRWAPVEFTDADGAAAGISVAYLKRLESILGLRFAVVADRAWSSALEAMQRGDLDLLPALAKTRERAERYAFTEPYLSMPVAIFAAADVAYLGDIEPALTGKKVAVVGDHAVADWLRRDHPALDLISTDTIEAALRLVARGDAFAFVGNLVTTSYYIGESGLSQIRVAGDTPYEYRLGMAVSRDQPLLLSILEKGLARIDDEERRAIYHDWIAIRYRHSIDYTWLWLVIGAGGSLMAVVLYWNRRLAREVQRRRRVEANLTEAKQAAEQANRAKSEFLANMSHELRTPMNAVLGFSSLLLETEHDPHNRHYLDAIRSSGTSLLRLIDDILDLSRVEAGKVELNFQAVELDAIFRELRLLHGQRAADKSLSLQFSREESAAGRLMLDEVRLRQILANLIGNAIKFTATGAIELRASARPAGDHRLRLLIAVEDSGEGIPADQQKQIFKLFTQRRGQDPARYGGTGLGLAISQRLAGLMGGCILLDSRSGRGSTFSVVLPQVARATTPVSKSATHGADVSLAGLGFAPATILVVDDVAINRRLLIEFLRDFELTVIEAGDGDQALRRVADHPPDLVLMDIAMPAPDGLEVTRRLKQDPATAAIPIIAVTAAVTAERRAEIERVCDGYLAKPVSRVALLSGLLPFLDHSERPAAAPASGAGAAAEVAPEDAVPDFSRVNVPTELKAALAGLKFPAVSINEVQALAERIIDAGQRRDDEPLTAAGRYLMARVRAFDLEGMRAGADALRAAAGAGPV